MIPDWEVEPDWVTANIDNGTCVEVAAVDRQWLQACGNGPSCVQVAVDGTAVAVRDSKTGQVLIFDRDEFSAFLDGCKRGVFDHIGKTPAPAGP